MLWLFQSLLLVFCLGSGNAVSQSSSTPMVVNGTLGKSVTLPLELPAGKKVNIIIWHYNEIAITIISLNESRNPQFLVPNSKWKERLKFTQTYSLILSNLTMADTGSYRAQIAMDTCAQVSSYTLRIFRQLKDLQIASYIQWSRNETCEIYLTCSVENPNDTLSFGWQVSRNISPSEPNLILSWNPKNSGDQNYTCIAENPVSYLSFSVSPQSLCKDILTNENLHSDHIWIIFIVPLILLVIVVCVLVWKKRTGYFCLPTQQTQPPGESSQNIEYALVPSGNTVYAQVTHTNQEMGISIPTKNKDSFTIYSEVNHS